MKKRLRVGRTFAVVSRLSVKAALRLQLTRGLCLPALVFTLAIPSMVYAQARTEGATYWKTRGNGFVLERRGADYRLFESTALSLLPIGSGQIRDGMLVYHDVPFISAREFFGMSDRIPCLPHASLTGLTSDSVKLFDLFWTTIDENYAFFHLLPSGEWRRLYARFRPQVQAHTTRDELWTIFATMIRRLNDGHTTLFDFNRGQAEASRPPSPSHWMMEKRDVYLTTIASYLDSFSLAENVFAHGNFIAGTIGGKIGYINLLAFDGYGERDLTTPLPGDSLFSVLTLLGGFLDEPAPFSALLDQVLGSFTDLSALVIDLRFNSGGSGDLAVELANRLTRGKRLAYTYRVRNGKHDQFEPPVRVQLTPKAPAFLEKPMIVLMSNNTMSAGDLAAMILRDLPGVVVIGETSYGIFSEGIPRQIPVEVPGEFPGWTLTLSTQRLYSARGEFFEQRGVPPDVHVEPDADALAAGSDNMLEAALELLSSHHGIRIR